MSLTVNFKVEWTSDAPDGANKYSTNPGAIVVNHPCDVLGEPTTVQYEVLTPFGLLKTSE
ncbi:MAG: hypothetical protein QM757_23415 [Paludibaculum sp.]